MRIRCHLSLGSTLLLRLACALTLLATWVVVPVYADPGGETSGTFALGLPEEAQAQQADFEQALADFEHAQEILKDNPGSARALFQEAARRFETLAAAGIVNGRLEFNLGNAWLQAGDLGRAILHYRRAERLIPGDPRLQDNLKLARARRLNTIRPSNRSQVLKTIFFWHHELAAAQRLRLALVLFLCFWLLLTLRNFGARRGLLVGTLVCILGAGLLGGSAAVSCWEDRQAPEGVVLALDVGVQKGPGKGYQRQFEEPLQPGVEFTLRERRGSWWQIELADGNQGWIEAETAELIPRTDQ